MSRDRHQASRSARPGARVAGAFLALLLWLLAPVSMLRAELSGIPLSADPRAAAALSRTKADLTARMQAATLAVNAIAAQVAAAKLDPIKFSSMRPALDKALIENADMLEIGVLTCDEWLRGEQRTAQGLARREEDFANRHALVRTIFDPDLERDTPVAYWADAAFTSIGGEVLTVRQRLLYHGAPRGLLIATIDIGSVLRSAEAAAPATYAFAKVDSKIVGASPAGLPSTVSVTDAIAKSAENLNNLLLVRLSLPCCGGSVQIGLARAPATPLAESKGQ